MMARTRAYPKGVNLRMDKETPAEKKPSKEIEQSALAHLVAEHLRHCAACQQLQAEKTEKEAPRGLHDHS